MHIHLCIYAQMIPYTCLDMHIHRYIQKFTYIHIYPYTNIFLFLNVLVSINMYIYRQRKVYI